MNIPFFTDLLIWTTRKHSFYLYTANLIIKQNCHRCFIANDARPEYADIYAHTGNCHYHSQFYLKYSLVCFHLNASFVVVLLVRPKIQFQ